MSKSGLENKINAIRGDNSLRLKPGVLAPNRPTDNVGALNVAPPYSDSNMAGIKGRSGPPKNNLNATRNGTNISRLTLGELPNTMRRQLQSARKYRRELEQLVFDAHGEVNATHAHLIDEAAAAEIHASVCRWLLRTRLDTMSTADVARCSEQILKAKTARNKAVERLKINAPPEPVSLGDYINGKVVDGTTKTSDG